MTSPCPHAVFAPLVLHVLRIKEACWHCPSFLWLLAHWHEELNVLRGSEWHLGDIEFNSKYPVV